MVGHVTGQRENTDTHSVNVSESVFESDPFRFGLKQTYCSRSVDGFAEESFQYMLWE